METRCLLEIPDVVLYDDIPFGDVMLSGACYFLGEWSTYTAVEATSTVSIQCNYSQTLKKSPRVDTATADWIVRPSYGM